MVAGAVPAPAPREGPAASVLKTEAFGSDVLEVLRSAREAISIAAYAIDWTEGCSALVEAVGRGVRVRVLLDARQCVAFMAAAVGQDAPASGGRLQAAGEED